MFFSDRTLPEIQLREIERGYTSSELHFEFLADGVVVGNVNFDVLPDRVRIFGIKTLDAFKRKRFATACIAGLLEKFNRPKAAPSSVLTTVEALEFWKGARHILGKKIELSEFHDEELKYLKELRRSK